jgi:hypothetical protein
MRPRAGRHRENQDRPEAEAKSGGEAEPELAAQAMAAAQPPPRKEADQREQEIIMKNGGRRQRSHGEPQAAEAKGPARDEIRGEPPGREIAKKKRGRGDRDGEDEIERVEIHAGAGDYQATGAGVSKVLWRRSGYVPGVAVAGLQIGWHARSLGCCRSRHARTDQRNRRRHD